MLFKKKYKIKFMVAVITATFSNFSFASDALDLVLINEGKAQTVSSEKLLSRFPNEMIGGSLDYMLSENPFNRDLVLAYDIKRRTRSIELFTKAYAFAINGFKKEIRESHPRSNITFEHPDVLYTLNKVKPGDVARYSGLSQYFVPGDLARDSENALSSYAIIYQYDTYLRLAYDYLQKEHPKKATREYASLLSAFYVMKNEGLDSFYPMYRYETLNFFNTDDNSYATSAWMMKVAASYYNELKGKGVLEILDNERVKEQVHNSLLKVSVPDFNQLTSLFTLSVYQKGFYDYYNLISPIMVENYSRLYDSRNCLSILPQLSTGSILYMIESTSSINTVCNISKQINAGKVDDKTITQISKEHSLRYLKNGKPNPKIKGSYGAMLLSDLSYVVDITGIGK